MAVAYVQEFAIADRSTTNYDFVAEKIGVPLPRMVDDKGFEARKRDSDEVIELNQWALSWWQDQLQSKAAASVRDYLKERGSWTSKSVNNESESTNSTFASTA